ncbi:Smyd3 [Symbiodinium pilosum]|uniref:Smyd3 protein n=1 Tax=Symbiodinium pilosum TaxID=2952 RepID=A0A812VHT4_SYMPI|nr:Smyd3 [Symbiodinium pilosum]
MSRNPDVGASMEDFISAFNACDGDGFEAFSKELLRRAGRALLRRTKGSLSGAFATLDITGEGEVRLPGFRAALLQFGDLNLTDEQMNKLWQLAKVIGGCKDDAMDFVSFKTVFGPSAVEAARDEGDGSAARPAPRDPGPSLEESCTHLYRLQRTEVLRAAIFRSAPEVYLPFELLAAAVREAAPELSDDEVAQVCRLAPQKGGPLHGEDAFSYGHLLERLESERKDFHPLNPRERGPAADMCRYVDQRLQAQGFVSLAAALEDAEVLRADILLDRLLTYLPQPIRPEDQRVVENLLRLGRPLRSGTLDVTEFCQRFELLARSGAAAGREPVAPAWV